MELVYALIHLRNRLDDHPPSVEVIEIAKTLIDLYPREDLPDWVEILANGNFADLLAVVETAKNDIAAEAQNDDEDL